MLSALTSTVCADVPSGRLPGRWDGEMATTAFGQAAFFLECFNLKGGPGLDECRQRACPFTYTGRHGSRREDILGTWVLSLLGERRRSARMNAICFDGVMPELLEVQRVVAEDAVRRFLKVIDQTAGMDWLQAHLAACIQP